MKTRMIKALGIAFALMLVLTTAAFAESGSGAGSLTAKGNGVAAVRGDLHVNLSGSGMLVVRDLAGDAKIEITGRGRKRVKDDQTTIYAGFDGKAEISGSHLAVEIVGRNIDLKAIGTGAFRLRGNGTFETNKASGEWTVAGMIGFIK